MKNLFGGVQKQFENMGGKMAALLNNNIENETVRYTQEDLQKADTEYVEAAKILNAIDFEAEIFDEENAYKAVQRYNKASKNYTKIHRALHPEMYTGENANKTILPAVEINQAAKIFRGAEGLSTKGPYKPIDKKN